MYNEFLRVNHAGEFGANQIYAGQHKVLKNTSDGPLIQHMWDQEKHHLDHFENVLIPKHQTQYSALLPLWRIGSYAMGYATAKMGKNAAMACTEAVETTIVEHYNDQLRQLLKDDPEKHKELMDAIKKFRDEEQEHHDIAIEEGAKQTVGYTVLNNVIKGICHVAIETTKRI